jgi:uncharacterized protein
MDTGQTRPAIKTIPGFIILFFFYHLPEIFQKLFDRPLIWLLEFGMAIFVLVAYWLIQKQKGMGMKPYGLFALKTHWRNLLIGFVVGLAIFAGNMFLTVLLGWNSMTIRISIAQTILYIFLFASGTLLPSLAEDLLTRAYLFAHWRGPGKNLLFILFSATVFVLNHIFKLNRPDILIYLFVLGCWLAWCLIYTGSLWLTLGIHWGANFAYQAFNNAVGIQTLRETGMENYMLASVYAFGFFMMWMFCRMKVAGRFIVRD